MFNKFQFINVVLKTHMDSVNYDEKYTWDYLANLHKVNVQPWEKNTPGEKLRSIFQNGLKYLDTNSQECAGGLDQNQMENCNKAIGLIYLFLAAVDNHSFPPLQRRSKSEQIACYAEVVLSDL